MKTTDLLERFRYQGADVTTPCSTNDKADQPPARVPDTRGFVPPLLIVRRALLDHVFHSGRRADEFGLPKWLWQERIVPEIRSTE